MPIKIDVYLSEVCGSYYELRGNIETAVAQADAHVEINYHMIYYDDAVSMLIKGSPTVWINGKDAFEGGNSPGIT
jgi:nitrate reductase alpha subunit